MGSNTLTLETQLSVATVRCAFARLVQNEPAQRVLNAEHRLDVRRELLSLMSQVDAFRSFAKHQTFKVAFHSSNGEEVTMEVGSTRSALANNTGDAMQTKECGKSVKEIRPKAPRLTAMTSSSLLEACSLLGLPKDEVVGGAAACALQRAQAAAIWADEQAAAPACSADSAPQTPARGAVRATSKRGPNPPEEDGMGEELLSSPPARGCPGSEQRTTQQSKRHRSSLALNSPAV